MPDNRTHYIGARFTKVERDSIKEVADRLNMSLSTLIREGVFSYLNILKETEEKVDKVDIILVKHKPKLFELPLDE